MNLLIIGSLNVDRIAYLRQVPGAGENRIAVIPGANALMTPDNIKTTLFRNMKDLLLQLETPLSKLPGVLSPPPRLCA